MKISVLQENLSAAIATVKPAVASRSTLPVLGNIKLEAAGDRFTLSATNLEIGIITHCLAQIKEPGSITIPARDLQEYVAALPPDRVDLTLNEKNNTLQLKCGRYQATLKGVGSDEFPVIPTAGNKDERAGIEPDIFKSLLNRSLFSAAQDDSRAVMTCVNCLFEKSQLTVSTADGFRLSVATAPLARAFDIPVTKLIPAKALQAVFKLIGDQDEPIFIVFKPNGTQVVFELAETVIAANLMDGNFPDVTQIIPKTSSTRVVLASSDLSNALKAGAVFARNNVNIAMLQIQPGTDQRGGEVTVYAQSDANGEGETRLEATIDGDDFKIGFNFKFLQDAINACDSPQVALELTTAGAPGIVRPVGRDDFTHVIMPMHIGEMKKPI